MFSKAPIIALTQLDRTTNTFVGKEIDREGERKKERMRERERVRKSSGGTNAKIDF